MQKIIIAFFGHERLYLFGNLYSVFFFGISTGKKMTKTFFTARKIFILVAKTQPNATAETAKCFPIGNRSFALGRMHNQLHHTTPFIFDKLHCIWWLFI